MLVFGFLGILVTFLVFEGFLTRQSDEGSVNNAVLDDSILAYHLDWNVIRDQKLLRYLYIKKVNAVVRYQNLAGVDYQQACDAIEHLLAHPELLPEIPQKRRPAMPETQDKQLRDFIVEGKLSEAEALYTQLLEVDQFTAQQVIERMEREHYVESIADVDISRLLSGDDETQAVTILRKRYGLTPGEAIHAIDVMLEQTIVD